MMCFAENATIHVDPETGRISAESPKPRPSFVLIGLDGPRFIVWLARKFGVRPHGQCQTCAQVRYHDGTACPQISYEEGTLRQ